MALQIGLLIFVALAALLGPRWPRSARVTLRVLGAMVAVGGLPLVLSGLRRLGEQLTPYPRPAEGGSLKQDGVYGLVRHPIYGGILLLVLAWALITSPLVLAPTAVLVGLFEAKHRREELWLTERFPDYAAYRRRVRHRFIPFLW